jgi:hypothetical protein
VSWSRTNASYKGDTQECEPIRVFSYFLGHLILSVLVLASDVSMRGRTSHRLSTFMGVFRPLPHLPIVSLPLVFSQHHTTHRLGSPCTFLPFSHPCLPCSFAWLYLRSLSRIGRGLTPTFAPFGLILLSVSTSLPLG